MFDDLLKIYIKYKYAQHNTKSKREQCTQNYQIPLPLPQLTFSVRRSVKLQTQRAGQHKNVKVI